eukprot:950289-Prymnesium_polylepis.1
MLRPPAGSTSEPTADPTLPFSPCMGRGPCMEFLVVLVPAEYGLVAKHEASVGGGLGGEGGEGPGGCGNHHGVGGLGVLAG